MERSDPPRPIGNDPPSVKHELPKPAAESEAAPAVEAPSEPVEPSVDAPLDEPEDFERAHFEASERETTQPLHRYTIAPAAVVLREEFPAATYFDPPAEDDVSAYATETASPVSKTELAPPDVYEDDLAARGEPWPAPLETTQPPSYADGVQEEPAITAAEAWIETPSTPDASPPDNVAIAEEEPALYASSRAEEPTYVEAPAASLAFEPQPFDVPPPSIARAPLFPEAPAKVDVPPPSAELPPSEPEPTKPVAPAPLPRLQTPTLAHDLAPAWSPAASMRYKPSFRSPAAPAAREVTPEPSVLPSPAGRKSDLFRRAANVAFLVFGGWLIAVLLLIGAYRFVNPPFSMLMALQWLSGNSIRKEWVPLERMSPNLGRAVIVAEDGRFCQHWGVDFIEAAHAIRHASDGYPRGASTITMQVAKNLFLIPAKSYLRKLVEVPLTFAIELAWPKWRILEVYLNIVEWGPGVFGAEAAAQSHFGRPAISLTPRQAAQLAVVLPNPIVRDAGSPGPRTAGRASVIQARAASNRSASACVEGRR